LTDMHAASKDSLWEELDSDDSRHSVLHYSLELGDYLIRVLQLSTCAPLLTRFFEVRPCLMLMPPPYSLPPACAAWSSAPSHSRTLVSHSSPPQRHSSETSVGHLEPGQCECRRTCKYRY
jgi:hypothetical protein